MNNQVTAIGVIETQFRLDIEEHNERFYQCLISIQRTSGKSDIIPVIVSERLIDVKQNCIGRYVYIKGQFRSHNYRDNRTGTTSLLLYLFPQEIELIDEHADANEIFLEGFICKKPTYRTTPLGREISDVILAVKRPYGKADYIPCVIWGRNAYYVSSLDVGACIRITGRVQSREYIKNEEVKTAYEVSVQMVEIVNS